MSILSSIIGGAAQIATAGINNAMAAERAAQDRRENYMYGEMAANNADRRTRALYNDFYSPAALLQQYNEAGLSPSIMYGGTPGQGGMSGAQGHGASGIQTPYMPMSIVEAAQAANLFAQTEKTKAETKNVQQDTILKQLQSNWDEMRNNIYSVEYDMLTQIWKNDDGTETSLYEMADNSSDYESFLSKVREGGNEKTVAQAGTEAGQKVLRSIYNNANRFSRDIAVLANEETDAKFKLDITNELKNAGFAKQNAKEAIETLKAKVAVAELTQQQKDAWNHILDKLGKNGSDTKDIIIVMGMIIGQALLK